MINAPQLLADLTKLQLHKFVDNVGEVVDRGPCGGSCPLDRPFCDHATEECIVSFGVAVHGLEPSPTRALRKRYQESAAPARYTRT